MAVTNRAQIEKLIYDIFDALDPTGMNTTKYKKILSAMNESEFEAFMKNYLNDPEEHFCFDLVEYENNLDFNNVEKAADILGIPLYEYVYLPHLTMDKNNIVCSQEKCLVGYLNIKRTQQMVQKKNGLTLDDEKRSAITGQVIDDDKNSKTSDTEAQIMVGLEMNETLKELLGPRGDDKYMAQEAMKQIENQGYLVMDDIETSPLNKVALNTINTYLLAMGLKTNLVTDSDILPKTSADIFK